MADDKSVPEYTELEVDKYLSVIANSEAVSKSCLWSTAFYQEIIMNRGRGAFVVFMDDAREYAKKCDQIEIGVASWRPWRPEGKVDDEITCQELFAGGTNPRARSVMTDYNIAHNCVILLCAYPSAQTSIRVTAILRPRNIYDMMCDTANVISQIYKCAVCDDPVRLAPLIEDTGRVAPMNMLHSCKKCNIVFFCGQDGHRPQDCVTHVNSCGGPREAKRRGQYIDMDRKRFGKRLFDAYPSEFAEGRSARYMLDPDVVLEATRDKIIPATRVVPTKKKGGKSRSEEKKTKAKKAAIATDEPVIPMKYDAEEGGFFVDGPWDGDSDARWIEAFEAMSVAAKRRVVSAKRKSTRKKVVAK